MKEELPKGQLQPRAQPVSAFIQQTSINPAAPAQPSQLRAPASFSLITTPGKPSIAGPSPEDAARAAGGDAERLAVALGRFNTELTQTAGRALDWYAKDQNERGMNEVMKAATMADRQQRQSAVEYGAANRDLAKKDPLAAMAMDQINPFRMGGRKRALATLAGQELPGAMALAFNDPKLLLEKPDSPLLTELRSKTVDGVLTKYGVSEGSPGFNDFVLPQLNRAWERSVAEQQDKRVKFLDSTIGRTGAIEMGNQLQNLITNQGMTPEQAAAAAQTSLDEILGAVGLPEKVSTYQEQVFRRAWEMARVDGNTPVMTALGQMLTGLPGEEGRIPVSLAYGLELGEINESVDSREYTQANRARSGDERGIRQAYLDLVADGMPEQQAVQTLINDPERFTSLTQAERIEALNSTVTAEANLEEKLFDDTNFQEFTNSQQDAAASGQWSDEQRAEFLEQGEKWVQSAPPGLRPQLREQIRRVRDENDAANARGINGRANQLIGERIDANIAREYAEGFGAGATSFGGSMTRAQDTAESRIRQRAAYTTHVNAYLGQQEQKLGRRLTESETIQFTNEALDGYGKKDPKQLVNLFPGGASGAPSSVRGGVVPAAPKPGGGGNARGESASKGQALPTTYTTSTIENAPNLREWNSQPLLDPKAALDTIPKVLNGGDFPSSFVRAAKKAGTSPGRLLLRQIEFMRDENGKPQFQLTPDQKNRILRQGERKASVENYSDNMVAITPNPQGDSPLGQGGPEYSPTTWARSWMRRLIEPTYTPVNPANPGDWRWRLTKPDGSPDDVGPGNGGYYQIGSLGNSTGAHAHVEKLSSDGRASVPIGPRDLDNFVAVDGQPISKSTVFTSAYGPRVHPVSGKAGFHHGGDWAPKGAGKLTLTNGAKWVSHNKSDNGTESIFRAPDGTLYRILHGTFKPGPSTSASRGSNPARTGPFASVNPRTSQDGMKSLLRAGFPRRGAAWLAGNIQQESGWNGSREWKDPGDGARAGGLVSWNDSAGSNRRLSQIETRLGKKVSQASHGEQLAAMVAEMREKYPAAYRVFMNPNSTDAQLKQASVAYWGYGHEGDRYTYARQLLGG